MMVKEFVKSNPGAILIYPSGPPSSLPPPEWYFEGGLETDFCQTEFFLKYCENIAEMPIDALLNNDCIAFMTGAEAAPWLPLWMCASLYAVDSLKDSTDISIHFAKCGLEKCLEVNQVPVSIQAIEYFAEHVCGPPEDEPELYAKIEEYRRRIASDGAAV